MSGNLDRREQSGGVWRLGPTVISGAPTGELPADRSSLTLLILLIRCANVSLIISSKVRRKLQTKHSVREEEIYECFASREGKYLTDTREDHKTDPPTVWFISETDRGRLLKVVFVVVFVQGKNGETFIKTAYEPNLIEIQIYNRKAK